MKLRKLPSGNWNARIYDYTDSDGKQHYRSFTAKHKYEIYNMISLWQQAPKSSDRQTVGEVVDKYIELCALHSPTTVYGYANIRRVAFPELMNVEVDTLDDIVMQEFINKEAQRIGRRGQLSPKTVRNNYGLISASLKKVCNKEFNVMLPKKIRKAKEYPDVKTVYNLIKGSEIELPCMLALWLSFSMSEIRGLTPDSIRNGIIYIDKVKVNVGTETVVKENAKVDARNRMLKCPAYIMELIEQTEAWKTQSGFLVNTRSDVLNDKFKALMKKGGIEDLTFHDLRHLNASLMLMLGVPDKYAQERGGWKTDHVMKTVYQHTFSAERDIVDARIDDFFENMKREHDTKS